MLTLHPTARLDGVMEDDPLLRWDQGGEHPSGLLRGSEESLAQERWCAKCMPHVLSFQNCSLCSCGQSNQHWLCCKEVLTLSRLFCRYRAEVLMEVTS